MARLALLAALAAPMLGAPVDRPLETLRKVHPRLIATDADLERVRSLIQSDARARSLYVALVEEALALEKSPTVEYKIIGPTIWRTAPKSLVARAIKSPTRLF